MKIIDQSIQIDVLQSITIKTANFFFLEVHKNDKSHKFRHLSLISFLPSHETNHTELSFSLLKL